MKISNVIEMPWIKDLSVNHMRHGRGGGYRRTEEIQGWMNRIAWEVKLLQVVNWGLPITIIVDWRYPDKRRRDDHNLYKAIADAVAEGLDIDDRHIRIRTGSVEVVPDDPGFTITLTDEDEA